MSTILQSAMHEADLIDSDAIIEDARVKCFENESAMVGYLAMALALLRKRDALNRQPPKSPDVQWVEYMAEELADAIDGWDGSEKQAVASFAEWRESMRKARPRTFTGEQRSTL